MLSPSPDVARLTARPAAPVWRTIERPKLCCTAAPPMSAIVPAKPDVALAGAKPTPRSGVPAPRAVTAANSGAPTEICAASILLTRLAAPRESMTTGLI